MSGGGLCRAGAVYVVYEGFDGGRTGADDGGGV